MQQLRRVADRRCALDIAQPRTCLVHLGAKPVQLARPPHRTRARSRMPPVRSGYPALLSTGEWMSDRKIPARRRAAKGHPAFSGATDGAAGAYRREFRDARTAREVRAQPRAYDARAG